MKLGARASTTITQPQLFLLPNRAGSFSKKSFQGCVVFCWRNSFGCHNQPVTPMKYIVQIQPFFILSVRVVNLIAAGVEAFLNKYGCDSPLWQRRVTDSAPISYTMLHPGWTAASWPFHRALEPLCVLGTSLSPVPALPHHVYVLISIHMYSPIPFYCALVHR